MHQAGCSRSLDEKRCAFFVHYPNRWLYKNMNDILSFENEITSHIYKCGSSLTINEFLPMVKENKESIIEDAISYGENENISFWDYISDEIVSTITVFKPENINIYVFKAPVNKVNPLLEELSLIEVKELEAMLLKEFSLSKPTASIQRSLGEQWLS